MRAEIAFRTQNVVDVDAAVVGISRLRWVSVEDGTPEDTARELMESRRFDVLPISLNDNYRAYFTTESWGDYSSISKRNILHSDVIHYSTPLREVVRRFAKEDRSFFFLEDEGEIAGLISVANFNCRQVKLFVLGLLIELEVRLGRAVQESLGSRFEAALTKACGPTSSREIMAQFAKDRTKGLDAPLIEYIYLSDLVRLAVVAKLHRQLGYSKKKFERTTGALVDLRNRVAHPNRSLIDPQHSVTRLWTRIDRAEELLFALR